MPGLGHRLIWFQRRTLGGKRLYQSLKPHSLYLCSWRVCFWGGAAAFAQSPSNGAIQVWVTPTIPGSRWEGVSHRGCRDYGTSQSRIRFSWRASTGNYQKLLLKKGTILVNTTQFNQGLNNANTPLNKTRPLDHLRRLGAGSVREWHGGLRGDHGLIESAMHSLGQSCLRRRAEAATLLTTPTRSPSTNALIIGSGTVAFSR